jgi:outer membrane immunogenic protein
MKKKIALAAAAVSLMFAGAASAADMAPRYAKAPPPAPVAVYNWTGWYVGVNGGGAWGNTDLVTVPTNGIFAASGFPGTQATILASQILNVKPTGGTAGGQAGYNWQASNWLFGIEADANYFGLRKSFGVGPTPTLGGTTISTNGSISTDYLITLRPRAGVVFDRLLLYVTGGLAVTEVKLSNNINILTSGVGPGSFVGSNSSTRAGWTVGAGAEWAFASNWRAKVEYLYADFGSVTTTSNLTGFATPFPAANGSAFTINAARLTTNIVRVGLNYSFNTPVVARY